MTHTPMTLNSASAPGPAPDHARLRQMADIDTLACYKQRSSWMCFGRPVHRTASSSRPWGMSRDDRGSITQTVPALPAPPPLNDFGVSAVSAGARKATPTSVPGSTPTSDIRIR
ncbi:hypothetical protein GCM10010276_21130 [Streptomyces longisporus]|uniref:Uncharacterized protein n=1 Tax=Streptomyces longisporus TaxID=1948 RepID=A0ABP5YLR4_STRLO